MATKKKTKLASLRPAGSPMHVAAWWLRDRGEHDAASVVALVAMMVERGDSVALSKLASAAADALKTRRGRRQSERTRLASTMRILLERDVGGDGLRYALLLARDQFPALARDQFPALEPKLGKPPKHARKLITDACPTLEPGAVVKEIFRMCGASARQADNVDAKSRQARSRKSRR